MNAVDLRGLAVAGKLAQNAEAFKGDGMPHGPSHLEPKYDGWRLIAYVGDGHVDLFSREGNGYGGQLPKIEAELLANFPPGTILDGEAVAITCVDGKVLNEWSTAQSVLTTLGGHAAADKITFMVFDLIAHAGIDARALPLANRRALLERIFEDEDEFEAIALTTVMEATRANYELLVEKGMEGAVVKRLNAAYSSGKREGGGWFKMKATWTADVVIMGTKPGKNGFTGMVGAIVFGQHDPVTGELVERGSCSGFNMKFRKLISKDPKAWEGRVIEIAHNGVDIGKSGSNRFRSPQFKRVRDDRTAESVVFHDA